MGIVVAEVVVGIICLLGWLAIRARAPSGWLATSLSTGAILVALHFGLSFFMKGDSIKIYTFGVVIIIGFLVGARYLTKQTDRLGLPSQRIFDWGFWLLLTGIVGSRILYVLLNEDEFRGNFGRVLAIWNGGLVWYGGLIPAVIVGVVLLYRWKLPVLPVCDACAAAIMLALGIGRWACLLAGDDYGKPTELWLGIRFYSGLVPHELQGVPLHPTQLYMSVNALWIFFVLEWIRRRATWAGQAFGAMLILYAGTRAFLIEPFRGDFVERNPGYGKYVVAEVVVERTGDGPAITLPRGAAVSGDGRTGRLLGGYDVAQDEKGERPLVRPIDVTLAPGQEMVRCFAISDKPLTPAETGAFHRFQWNVDKIEGLEGATVKTYRVRPYKSDLPQPPGYVSTSQWISVLVALGGVLILFVGYRLRQPGFTEAAAARAA
jgi:phosphatidylglycerol:prolipoprotein diacylglycerol transferase